LTLSFSVDQSYERPSIVVIDRYPLSRSCLARILRSEFPDFVILEIETPYHLDTVVGRHISLGVLDIGSSGMADEQVLQSLSYLRRSLPEGPLILVTRLEESTISDSMISAVTRFGVRGCIADSDSVEIALAALRLVIAGGVYFPRSLAADRANWGPVSSENVVPLQPTMATNGAAAAELPAIASRTDVAFTERERQVLAALLRGMSNKIIANELTLSQNTVKSHISRIMHKLHARNRTEAVVLSQHSLHATNGSSRSVSDT
jgi:DNA-binding NarL/FixJ family response regulator